MQICSSGTPARACSICSPQPVQVTFPQDEHETGEHILVSYIRSSLHGDGWEGWGGIGGKWLAMPIDICRCGSLERNISESLSTSGKRSTRCKETLPFKIPVLLYDFCHQCLVIQPILQKLSERFQLQPCGQQKEIRVQSFNYVQ